MDFICFGEQLTNIAYIPEGTTLLDCSCNEELCVFPSFPTSLRTIFCWDCGFEEEYLDAVRKQYPDIEIISEDVIQTEEEVRKGMEDFLSKLSEKDRAIFVQVMIQSRKDILDEFSEDSDNTIN